MSPPWVNFKSSDKEKKNVLDHYKESHVDHLPELANVSLWKFATSWDWKGKSQYYPHGTTGAKKYVIDLWPHPQHDHDEPEIYENYWYAKLLLHHPFIDDSDLLLGNHLDWTAVLE